jgi:hypothetical protein
MKKDTVKKSTKQEVQVEVKALQREAFEVTIIGETPLITHAWSKKAKMEMLSKQLGVERVRATKDPYQDYIDSMYRFDDGSYGFPVVALKECIATATTDLEGIHKTQIFRNLFVTGKRGFQIAAFMDILSPIELGVLSSPNPPVLREDMVNLSGMKKTPDLRYRAEFWPWAFRCNISYFSEFLSYESILNLLHQAGLRVGLGEWRQEKGGTNGAFHPADKDEIKMVDKWLKQGHKEPEKMSVSDFVNGLRTDRKKLRVA